MQETPSVRAEHHLQNPPQLSVRVALVEDGIWCGPVATVSQTHGVQVSRKSEGRSPKQDGQASTPRSIFAEGHSEQARLEKHKQTRHHQPLVDFEFRMTHCRFNGYIVRALRRPVQLLLTPVPPPPLCAHFCAQHSTAQRRPKTPSKEQETQGRTCWGSR